VKAKKITLTGAEFLDHMRKDRTPKSQDDYGWYPEGGFGQFNTKHATCAFGGVARRLGVEPDTLVGVIPNEPARLIFTTNDETKTSKKRIADLVAEKFPKFLTRKITVPLPQAEV